MTKFEYLKEKAQPNNTRDNILVACTWKATGGKTCSNNTKMYSKDSILKVNSSKNKEIDKCLIMCLDDVMKTVDWSKAKVFDPSRGEITFGNNIVSPVFRLLMLAEDLDSALKDDSYQLIYDSFTPFENLNQTSNVIIDENTYQRIISVLGAPFIGEDELEYTREQITDLAIRPALEEYFHWVPPLREPTVVNTSNGGGTGTVTYKRKTVTDPDTGEVTETDEWVGESASVSNDGGLIVDMPSDAYGVTGISLQQSGMSLEGNILSPMFYAMEQSLYSGFSYSALSGTYNGRSPYTNTNTIGGMLGSRAASQALVNYTRRVHYEGPYGPDASHPNGKYIKLYSNISGVFNVWWAKESLDFNDVEYANRRRVIEYAQACVKELFANLRGQAKSDIPGQYDYNQWKAEAKEAKQTITDEWKKLVKYAGVIRGSL